MPNAGPPPRASDPPLKRDCRWLARPRKRHYTFARRLDHVTAIRVAARRHRPFKALICRVYLF